MANSAPSNPRPRILSAFLRAQVSQQPRGYRPIKDYAVIGDCHGAALIARDGDIDWCCLGRFDADPVFFRLLDARRGGFLSTRLREPRTAVRRYLEESNILRTDLIGPSGHVILIDFMPVGRKPEAGIHDYVSLNAPHWLVRCIEVQEGEVTIDAHMDRSHSFSGGPVSDIELVTDLKSGETDSRWSETLHAGDRRFIAIGAGARGVTAERVAELRAITNAYWREWIAYCRYDGQHGAMVRRSALALKLLCYAPTGAIAAAITTSLPEEIGGERNWDYRACWVRDASLMLFALSSLGYSGESQQFYDFLRHAMEDGPDKLLIGYGLEMERELPARELAHLEGYVGSTPVRVGNGAFTQKQWDLYGFVLEGALVYQTLGGRVSLEDRKRFGELVEFMGRCWECPDKGIWEVNNGPSHFVHSKAMCWAAVDCGLRLLGRNAEHEALRGRIRSSIAQHGFAGDGGFRRAYGEDAVDGALLLLPALGLPFDAQCHTRTLDAIQRSLRDGDYVYRYRADDGLAGDEGAFLACSFWMVDALLAAGRGEGARALFDRLVTDANDVGLYAEEADPDSGEFLGNFPQALTHLGLVTSAINLDLYAKGGVKALGGHYADRARRAVKATLGWRGVIAGVLHKPSLLRLRSSRASRLSL